MPDAYASNPEINRADRDAKVPATHDIYRRYWERCHVVVNDGQYTDTAVVTVKLTDVNEPPHFGDNIPVLTVDENAPADTHVGVVTASDVDGTENLTYSIIDETGTFKISLKFTLWFTTTPLWPAVRPSRPA